MADTIEILFFGDVVGRPGRRAVAQYLARRAENPADIVIANVENATHGFGVSPTHYQDFLTMGVHIMTGGNHIWDRKELLPFMDEATALVRPANFIGESPGLGARVFTIGGHRIGVLNLMGQVYMPHTNSAYEAMQRWIPELKAQAPIVFVDIHAEATAEKNALAYVAADMGVSAMTGTHTQVQTADNRVIPGKDGHAMGFITDAGFNGPYDSVIGMEKSGSIARLVSSLPSKLEVGPEAVLQVNAVRYWVNPTTGICSKVERVFEVI
jgi:metallophosphoesterase (TIGR00282 family)